VAPAAPSAAWEIPEGKKSQRQNHRRRSFGSLYYDFVKTGQTIKAKTYVVEGIGEDFFSNNYESENSWMTSFRSMTRNVSSSRAAWPSWRACSPVAPEAAAFPVRASGKDLGPNDFVVALLPDTGTRYLSKVYNDLWMHERGYVDAATAITAAEVVNAKHAAGKVRELVICAALPDCFPRLKTMQEQDIRRSQY